MVWSGCCVCFFCLSVTLNRGVYNNRDVYNPSYGQQFALLWCSVPSLGAETFLLTHAVWQQGDSGQGIAFCGLWWLTASLWSSRTLPLRLNMVTLWNNFLSTESIAGGKKKIILSRLALYIFWCLCLAFYQALCLIGSQSHYHQPSEAELNYFLTYVSRRDASAQKIPAAECVCVQHALFGCYFLNKIACSVWGIGWSGC